MILVLGAGTVGRTIARDISNYDSVTVCDVSLAALKSVDGVRKVKGNIFDHPHILERADAVISSLPGSISFGTVSKILGAGKTVIDTSFMPEDPFRLDRIANAGRCIYVPDAGYAPGLTNALAGHIYAEHKPESITIYVGGLPESDTSPLHHAVTFNVEGLVDEYLRPARMVRDGRIVSVDPLSETVEIDFPQVGRLEGFYSDGLRTMLKTMKVREMSEITLRYPGHLAVMRALVCLGFFSGRRIGGCSPREISEALLSGTDRNFRDMCVTRVTARWDGRRIDYSSVDRYDSSTSTSSMARMTGYSASAFARIVLGGEIAGSGVMPPEYFGFNSSVFRALLRALRSRGIVFRKSVQ